MSVFPKAKFSIVYFSTRYSSEGSCRELFFRLRFPHGFVCPHCGGNKLGTVRTRSLYRCRSCRKQISATSGTVFHGTHISSDNASSYKKGLAENFFIILSHLTLPARSL